MNSRIKIRIGDGDNYFFGPGVAELLRNIDETGSVRGAAAMMELSYSKAWHMLKNSEEGFKRKLVVRVTGGRGGGMAELTPDGKRIAELFRELENRLQKDADRLFGSIFGEYL